MARKKYTEADYAVNAKQPSPQTPLDELKLAYHNTTGAKKNDESLLALKKEYAEMLEEMKRAKSARDKQRRKMDKLLDIITNAENEYVIDSMNQLNAEGRLTIDGPQSSAPIKQSSTSKPSSNKSVEPNSKSVKPEQLQSTKSTIGNSVKAKSSEDFMAGIGNDSTAE